MTARQYHSKTVKCKGCLIAKNNTHHREDLGPRIKYLARLMLPAIWAYHLHSKCVESETQRH